MGVPYPQADGIVLADALANPNIIDEQRQRYVARYLVPYVAALRKQASLDVRGLPAMKRQKPVHATAHTIAMGPGY